MISQEALKRTPLYEKHCSLHARMVPFGGWEMPLQYEGILAEYESTRRGAAVFDTSHMGEFLIEGDCRATGLDNIVTCALADMPLKTCRYGAALKESGGIVDDLIVFRVDTEKWFVVVNGATTEKDAAHFRKYLRAGSSFRNISTELGKLDIQGPLAREVLAPLVKGIEKLEYYTFDEFDVLGEKVIVSRTGYTGELGYEIYFPWAKTSVLWDAVFRDKRVKPAGLGARDVLRLEMGYSLYGHELDENISPLEAGLGKFVDLNKDFVGKDVLVRQKAEGPKKKIICFKSETRRSPRAEHKIYDESGRAIGYVTSGTFSPALKCGIGMGYADNPPAKGQKIFFGDGDAKLPGEVTSRPFYKQGSLKN